MLLTIYLRLAAVLASGRARYAIAQSIERLEKRAQEIATSRGSRSR